MCACLCVIVNVQEVVIAYLPLAHILELLVEMMSFSQGACVGYAHPRTLTASSPYVKTNSLGVPEAGFESDLMVLRPSVMAAVPAVLDLIAGGLKKKVSVCVCVCVCVFVWCVCVCMCVCVCVSAILTYLQLD